MQHDRALALYSILEHIQKVNQIVHCSEQLGLFRFGFQTLSSCNGLGLDKCDEIYHLSIVKFDEYIIER